MPLTSNDGSDSLSNISLCHSCQVVEGLGIRESTLSIIGLDYFVFGCQLCAQLQLCQMAQSRSYARGFCIISLCGVCHEIFLHNRLYTDYTLDWCAYSPYNSFGRSQMRIQSAKYSSLLSTRLLCGFPNLGTTTSLKSLQYTNRASIC